MAIELLLEAPTVYIDGSGIERQALHGHCLPRFHSCLGRVFFWKYTLLLSTHLLELRNHGVFCRIKNLSRAGPCIDSTGIACSSNWEIAKNMMAVFPFFFRYQFVLANDVCRADGFWQVSREQNSTVVLVLES